MKPLENIPALSISEENLLFILHEIRFLDIIFTHPAVSFSFLPDLAEDIYEITDSRLLDLSKWDTPLSNYDIFFENIRASIETVKGTILLPYNTAVASCTAVLQDLFKSRERNPVICLSFFHNDDDIAAAHPENSKDFISVSHTLFEQINQYPFIKIFNIPMDYQMGLLNLMSCR